MNNGTIFKSAHFDSYAFLGCEHKLMWSKEYSQKMLMLVLKWSLILSLYIYQASAGCSSNVYTETDQGDKYYNFPKTVVEVSMIFSFLLHCSSNLDSLKLKEKQR